MTKEGGNRAFMDFLRTNSLQFDIYQSITRAVRSRNLDERTPLSEYTYPSADYKKWLRTISGDRPGLSQPNQAVSEPFSKTDAVASSGVDESNTTEQSRDQYSHDTDQIKN